MTRLYTRIHLNHNLTKMYFWRCDFCFKIARFWVSLERVKTIWIKLYDHSAKHVLGVFVDFYTWARRFTCLTMGSSTSFEKVYFAPNVRDFG